jgi:hypothetical protein
MRSILTDLANVARLYTQRHVFVCVIFDQAVLRFTHHSRSPRDASQTGVDILRSVELL